MTNKWNKFYKLRKTSPTHPSFAFCISLFHYLSLLSQQHLQCLFNNDQWLSIWLKILVKIPFIPITMFTQTTNLFLLSPKIQIGLSPTSNRKYILPTSLIMSPQITILSRQFVSIRSLPSHLQIRGNNIDENLQKVSTT